MRGRLTEMRVLLATPQTRKLTMLAILRAGRASGSVANTAVALGLSPRTLTAILAADDELRARWDSLRRPCKTQGYRR